jgi:hypothetical protein
MEVRVIVSPHVAEMATAARGTKVSIPKGKTATAAAVTRGFQALVSQVGDWFERCPFISSVVQLLYPLLSLRYL